jgi:DNA-binding MarR family transcriptional regulator
MAEKGIHPGQAFCLAEVAHNDGVTQRDLAEALGISRPTLTVMLQKMEKSGLVERRADELDQRYTRIHLTAAGADTHAEMHAVMGDIVSKTFGQLTDADNAELRRLISTLNDNMVALSGSADATRHAATPQDIEK